MSYATLTDVTARYRPITTMIGSGSYDVSSVEVASIFIADAESYVDGWLASKYNVPLASPAPPLITQVTADLAISNMLSEKLPQIPEFIDKRRDRAIKTLQSLAAGSMSLGNSWSVVGSVGDNFAWSANMGYHPTFDPALSADEQTVDIQRVDAALTEREDDC